MGEAGVMMHVAVDHDPLAILRSGIERRRACFAFRQSQCSSRRISSTSVCSISTSTRARLSLRHSPKHPPWSYLETYKYSHPEAPCRGRLFSPIPQSGSTQHLALRRVRLIDLWLVSRILSLHRLPVPSVALQCRVSRTSVWAVPKAP